ncbi:hypothetical protein BST85_08085 [Aureitalea marina]|uniref:DUF819 family protein n=1 Tax=Aureitalea marina TaxID=930804 RepID=A0A2S7KU10_9FLAO|nr:hypothetical protein BST85_08085 [Aureitalea marina]
MTNPIYVLMMLCLMVVLSYFAAKTKIGKKFGIALLAIVFTAVIANLGLIPSASNSIPLYDGIFTYLAPISIFYLLLGVNLRSIKKAGGPMIALFLIGSLATVMGILFSWWIIDPASTLGEDAGILAGMLTGTYTGGSINFNAIALQYGFQEKGALYAGTIAVDNVVTTLWIIVTLAIPAIMRPYWKDRRIEIEQSKDEKVSEMPIGYKSLALLVLLGLVAFWITQLVKEWVPQIPSIITITTLGILLAQNKSVARLKGSQPLGLYLVYIFLAVIGAYCEIASVIELKQIGLTLLLFTGLGVIIHGVLTILLGGLFLRDWDMVAISSQANIGGGTTAIALAETFGRKELVLPAILVGTLGNALGTYLGFMVIYLL